MGLLVGSLVGLTGMGGGAIMTPVLILLLGVAPLTAVGTDLAYASVTKIVGAVTHYKQNTVDLKVAGYLALGGVPASMLGVYLLNYLKGSQYPVDSFIRAVLGVVLIIVAFFMLIQTILNKKDWRNKHNGLSKLPPKISFYTITVGFIVGLLVGVTSVGSGVLIITFLLLLHPIQDEKIVGTDLVTAAFLVTTAGLSHLISGHVDFKLAGFLLLGSIPGAYLGSKIHIKTPMKGIRIILGLVILASGIALIKI